jgi:hypothetical protein
VLRPSRADDAAPFGDAGREALADVLTLAANHPKNPASNVRPNDSGHRT